ncbi:SDR family oxidoreductase [Geomicrobium sp. JCM 19038]|uniref:SDR family NAD(P)-dependent oxidoreductase n=1 Tax=Geomicrobium sp. JCM 19038 TaxID=1460635 RepID=UPI00045F3F2E|nr:SDR family oxidoreductase [Geomicrobium sp. JCM 19038]GAK08017.1 3-oxoacyl-[acyl-carrier protein] reductase [Geomicrobium sp. JCM 19038]
MNLTGLVAVITGAGTGVGKATSELLASQGATVYLVGRRKYKLEEVTKNINETGGKAYAFQADITNIDEINQLKRFILVKENRVDILINNAGIGGKPTSVYEHSVDDWRYSIELNLNSAFYMTNAFLPILRKQKSGYVISLTSMMVNLNYEGFSAYSAAKSGLEILMKTLQEEERQNGIYVSIVDPGNVKSEQNQDGKERPERIAELIYDCIQFPDEKNANIIRLY